MTSETRLIGRCLTTIVVVALAVSPLPLRADTATTAHACCVTKARAAHCQPTTVLQCCRAPERPDVPSTPPSPSHSAAQPVTYATTGPADLVPPFRPTCSLEPARETRRIDDGLPLYLLNTVLLV